MTLQQAEQLHEWNRREMLAWVKCALEKGFDLRTLEDRDLRVACFNEYNAQIGAKAERERRS